MRRANDRPTNRRPIATERLRRRRGAATLAVVLAALGGALAKESTGSASVGSATVEGDGFSSAEDAVTAYTDALAAGDFDALFQTFATETYVEHFDFEASLERLGVYQPLVGGLPLPSGDPFNEAINVEQRRAAVAGMIRNQYFTLANPELDIRMAQPLADAEAVEQLTSSLQTTMQPAELAGFAAAEFVELDDVDALSAERLASDASRAHDEEMLAVIGADESAELAVRTTIGDLDVIATFRAVRYGENWWLETLGGQFAALAGLSFVRSGVLLES
jgi:hypothetical protein